MIFFLTKYLFHIWNGFQRAVNFYDMGPTALLLLRRRASCGFLSQLNIYRPRSVLKPLKLGPMTSTLATTPPRSTNIEYYFAVCCLN
jgi:hypothetical protein